MGMTNVTLTMKNVADPKRQVKGEFLVDSGAGYTVVPEVMVEKLRLRPSFVREFVLADGRKVKRSVGSVLVGYGDEEVASPVVLGKKGDSALLGAITLEAFGLVLDPFARKLYKAKMML